MASSHHFLHLAIGISFLGALACGEKAPDSEPVRPRTGATTETRGAPSWIDNEDAIPGKLGAVGIAQPNALNDRGMQRDMALTDARAKLASKLNAKVHASTSASSQASMSATNEGKARTASSSATTVQISFTRQRADALLSGAQPWQWWNDPKDGTLYVFLVVDKEGN